MERRSYNVIRTIAICFLTYLSQGKADKADPVLIMTFGVFGSGKSAMVNAILNQSQIDWKVQPTLGIVEYSIPSFDSKTEIRIIDTPDFHDANGFETDARLLVTLEDYLDNHEYLKMRVPDVVLVCQDFDSDVPLDENSKFVKMLKSILTMKSRFLRQQDDHDDVDNVIVALMQKQPMSARSSRRKIREMRYAIGEYSIIPGDSVPMAIVKNEENFINNLCSEINSMVQNARPGLSAKYIKVCHAHEQPKLISNITLVDISHPKAARKLNLLVGINTKPSDTEIGSILKTSYDRMSFSDIDILKYLQTSFHERQIFRLADLPETDLELTSLYRMLRKSSNVRLILKDAFDFTSLSYTPLIGHGYSLVMDEMLPTSPLKFEPSENVSCMGYRLPLGIDCHARELALKQVMKYASTQEEYINYRDQALGLHTKNFSKIEHLQNVKSGYTFPGATRNSIYAELQVYDVHIQDFGFTEEFKTVLNQLPRFDATSRVALSEYEQFFDEYGIQIVTRIGYGGTLEVQVGDSWDLEPENPLKTIIDLIQNKNEKRNEDSIIMSINGGDTDFHVTDPFIFFAESKGKSLFSKWKDSLIEYSVPLTHTPSGLTPITIMLKTMAPTAQRLQDLEMALVYFNGDDYEVDAVGKQLNRLIGLCSNDLKELKYNSAECEKSVESLHLRCNAEQQKCKPIREEIKSLLSGKLSAQSDLNAVKSAVSSKDVEKSGLKLKHSEMEGKIKQIEASIQYTREELTNEKAHSSKLQALLNSRG